MKKMLIIINSLSGGGAEKSLVSLLNELKDYKDEFEIDLLLPNKDGLFQEQIPDFVNEIIIPEDLMYMSHNLKSVLRFKRHNFKCLFKKLYCTFIMKKMKNETSGIKEQKLWSIWKNMLKPLDEEYDIAIGYLNGYPNYYVCDKVKAKNKILWIHNEYKKLGYNDRFDYPYFKEANFIITISQLCVDSFTDVFPEFKNKVMVLENITSGSLVHSMSNSIVNYPTYFNDKCIKILSIGRFVPQKNFSLALKTVKKLKEKNPSLNFKWYFIGDGQEYKMLLELVNLLDISSNVCFLGVTENPYPFIKNADIFVQTSKFEGKSIVIDEAKILQKLIVCTDYSTVYNSIDNGVTGLICNMDENAISESIMLLLSNEKLKTKILDNLTRFKKGNSDEIKKYVKVFNNVW